MKHLNEDELVAYRYGEIAGGESRDAIARHLRDCAECRASFETLVRVLELVEAAPVPERDERYSQRVWQQIAPRLEPHPAFDWRAWLAPRRLAAVGTMAVLILAAFLAGRFWQQKKTPDVAGTAPAPQQIRERVLLVAVGDHLDRSEMVLVELVNADAPTASGQELDISIEKERAEQLVVVNRLYRQTASSSGDAAMASVLDDLERVLLEIAHSPDKVSSAEFATLRRNIEKRGILLKVRVVGSDVREREKSAVQGSKGNHS
jgi:hypothetical protein